MLVGLVHAEEAEISTEEGMEKNNRQREERSGSAGTCSHHHRPPPPAWTWGWRTSLSRTLALARVCLGCMHELIRCTQSSERLIVVKLIRRQVFRKGVEHALRLGSMTACRRFTMLRSPPAHTKCSWQHPTECEHTTSCRQRAGTTTTGSSNEVQGRAPTGS